MSTDGQCTKWHRNIAENFNRLSRVHQRYRQQTDNKETTDRRTGDDMKTENNGLQAECYACNILILLN